MPRIIVYTLLILTLLAILPPVVIAQVRSKPNPNLPINLIQDMDLQAKFKAQSMNDLFSDGRSQRVQVAGTIARGEAALDTHFNQGVVDGQWASSFPERLPANMELMKRGEGRFNIYCSPCHGYSGGGNGAVNQRALELVANADGPVNGTVWVAAKSLHDATITIQPVGQLFNTVTYGIRNMAGYQSQIPVEDRWAIVAYVKALQRSQDAALNDVPTDKRGGL
ncbi:MAG: cytochrome c [Phycisphaerales bacterium]|nr:cytochrome c [Phycisphaerales bacterium]